MFEFDAKITFESVKSPELILVTLDGAAAELELLVDAGAVEPTPIVIPPGTNGLINSQKIASTPFDCN